MARGRMVSKALSTSKKFAAVGRAELGEFAQLLYPLLVAHSDDFGRQEGDPFTVKHKVLPTSARTEDEFAAALGLLRTAGLIDWYATDSKGLVVQIVKFEPHQSGLHKRSISVFPEPPGIPGNFREIPSELNRTELNRTEGNRTEPKGTEGNGTVVPDPFASVERDVWLAVIEHLKTQGKSAHALESWFEPCSCFRQTERLIEIAAPTPMIARWLVDHYRASIDEALAVVRPGMGWSVIVKPQAVAQ